MSSKKGLGSEIYSGAAGFGKAYAIFGAVVATLIAIGLIIGGIYIIYHRGHLLEVQGTVTRSSYNCATSSDKDGNKHTSCKVDVAYQVRGQSYTKTFNDETKYDSGTKLEVYYEPNDPRDSYIRPVPKAIGWFMILGALVVGAGSWLWVYLTQKYKFAAAAAGVGGAYRMIR